MQTQLEKAKNYAIRLLSYRSRSEYELRSRLKKSGYQINVIEQVVSFLKEYDYINDQVFAERWIRDRMVLKPMGRIRLKWELQQKGIARDIINVALDGIGDDEEYRIALDLVKKIYINRDRPYSISKVISFLQRRGFSVGVIMSICNNIENMGSV